ncbi:MAG: hypothetical protein AABY14_05060 [Nanoarchaeota archaeon]
MICFLFIATNTFAISNIATINAYGSNKIEGVISNNDQVEFIVTANIDGDSDLNGNLILGEPIDQTRVIQIGIFTCKTETTGTLCNLKYPTDKPMQFNQKEKKFRILLINDVKFNLDQKDISLFVDNTAPIIKEFVISNTKELQGKKFSSDGNVSLNFKADEQGYNGDTSSCSGLRAVEFYFGTDKIAECKDTCLGINNCILPTTTKEYTHQGTGEVMLFAKAIDILDKMSVENCVTFFIDK